MISFAPSVMGRHSCDSDHICRKALHVRNSRHRGHQPARRIRKRLDPAARPVLVSIALVLEIVSLSSTMAAVAMMPIGEHFETDQVAWVTTAYLLAAAVACPLAGKLADIHGKRKVFLIAMAIAAVGALMSAVAPSFLVLVIGRGLFGVLIACMFLGFSLMRDVFPPKTLRSR